LTKVPSTTNIANLFTKSTHTLSLVHKHTPTKHDTNSSPEMAKGDNSDKIPPKVDNLMGSQANMQQATHITSPCRNYSKSPSLPSPSYEYYTNKSISPSKRQKHLSVFYNLLPSLTHTKSTQPFTI